MSMTPLGKPVVPLVYAMVATSWLAHATSRRRAPAQRVTTSAIKVLEFFKTPALLSSGTQAPSAGQSSDTLLQIVSAPLPFLPLVSVAGHSPFPAAASMAWRLVLPACRKLAKLCTGKGVVAAPLVASSPHSTTANLMRSASAPSIGASLASTSGVSTTTAVLRTESGTDADQASARSRRKDWLTQSDIRQRRQCSSLWLCHHVSFDLCSPLLVQMPELCTRTCLAQDLA